LDARPPPDPPPPPVVVDGVVDWAVDGVVEGVELDDGDDEPPQAASATTAIKLPARTPIRAFRNRVCVAIVSSCISWGVFVVMFLENSTPLKRH
jgi:hypothetical protein